MKKIGLSLLAVMLIALFMIPNIVEYYIEDNDLELIHREIIIGDLDINYLTGNVSLESMYLLEQNAIDTFAGFELIDVNLGIWSSLMGEYTIESVELSSPMVRIISYDSLFNFSDLLVPEQTPDDSVEVSVSEPIAYHLGEISIKGLKARYSDQNGDIGVQDFDLELNPFSWNKQLIRGQVSLALSEGGTIQSSFSTDLESGDYETSIDIDELSLIQFSAFVKPYLNIKHLAGQYSHKLSIKGNFLEDADLNIKGELGLTDFRLIDQYSLEIAAFKDFHIGIDTIDVGNSEFHFSTITLDQALVDFSLFDDTNSISELFPLEELDSTAIIADSVQIEQVDTTMTHYSIGKFALTDGAVRFQDHTLIDYLDYSIYALQVVADSVNSQRPQTVIKTSALLEYRGIADITINYDFSDSKNFGYAAKVKDVPLVDFSPYSVQYVGSPINTGALSFTGSAETTRHFLRSENELLLDQLQLGDKVKHSERYKLPVKTAVSMLKNTKGEVKIKLPVRGNLDDPTFKVWRTVLNTLKNLVVKTVSSPVSMIGKAVTKADKDVEEVDYQYLQSTLSKEQKGILKNIANRIKKRKGHQAAIMQYTNPTKEKAMIAIYEAKKKYYESAINSIGFTKNKARKILPINSAFQQFVNECTPQDSVMNLEERCAMILGNEVVEGLFEKLVNQRNEEVRKLLQDNKGILIETALYEANKLNTHRPVFKIRAY